jgi:hypothetical protein
MDDLGFVEAIDGLGESVVITVADAADRRFDARLRQALGVLDRDVLHAAIGMMDEATALERTPVMKRLLQRVENEARMGRAADSPVDYAPSESINHKGDVNEAVPGQDIGEVGDPERVRPRRSDLTVHMIQWAGRGLIAYGRAHGLAADHPLKAHQDSAWWSQTRPTHQPRHRAPSDLLALTPELAPDLAHAIDLKVGIEYPPNFSLQEGVAAYSSGQLARIGALGDMGVISGPRLASPSRVRRGDCQDAANRLDPVRRAMIINEGDHRLNGPSSSAWAK